MKNQFSFNIYVRCGKRTEPEVGVSYSGSAEKTMQIGNLAFTKEYLAKWIEETILLRIKTAHKQLVK